MIRDITARPAPRHLCTVAAVAALALLSACGSSTTSAAAPKASLKASAAASVSSPATDSPAPVVSSAAPTSSGGSDPNSSFCLVAKNEEAQANKAFNQLSTGSSAEIKNYFETFKAQLPGFVAAAPSSIRSDVEIVVADSNKLFDILEMNNFDFAKSEAAVEAIVSKPDATAAEKNVDAYLMLACGIDTGGSSAAPTATATP